MSQLLKIIDVSEVKTDKNNEEYKTLKMVNMEHIPGVGLVEGNKITGRNAWKDRDNAFYKNKGDKLLGTYFAAEVEEPYEVEGRTARTYGAVVFQGETPEQVFRRAGHTIKSKASAPPTPPTGDEQEETSVADEAPKREMA